MNENEIRPTRLQELMVTVLSLFDRSIGAIEFAKLIYLVDVEAVKLTGKTISKQDYIRLPKGPVPVDFSKDKEELEGFEINQEFGMSSGTSKIPKINHNIGSRIRFSVSFNEVEETIIRKAISKLKAFSPIELESIAYRTEPMKAITDVEIKLCKQKIGEKLNLDLIQPNKRMDMWRNMPKKEISVDQDYLAIYEKEKKEFKEILSAPE